VSVQAPILPFAVIFLIHIAVRDREVRRLNFSFVIIQHGRIQISAEQKESSARIPVTEIYLSNMSDPPHIRFNDCPHMSLRV